MFFKKDETINKESIDTAVFGTFMFWGCTLLINALFEVIDDKPLIGDSNVILSAGLFIFYATEKIADYYHKRKRS
ncbi:hypothetical protein LCL98_10460 [Rossellomorea aquimaris]|nr:hypothetical protein [Rossellomorea aquimaris]